MVAVIDRCLVCGSEGRLWVHRRGRDLVRCRACGFAWIPQGVMRTASGSTIYEDDAPIFFSPEQSDYYRDESTIDAARAKLETSSMARNILNHAALASQQGRRDLAGEA